MAEQHNFHPFSIAIAESQDAVRDGIAQAMLRLAPLGLPRDAASSVELVLAEALNNTIEHALQRVTRKTQIEIRGDYKTGVLHLTIIDQGKPMPNGAVPTGPAPKLDVDMPNIPEGGFGWYMIHSLARKIEYMRVGNTNHLNLHFDIKP